MKTIIEIITNNRKGRYVHAFEGCLEDFQNAIDMIYSEFINTHTKKDIIEFFESIELYYLNTYDEEQDTDEETEQIRKDELYSFNIEDYIEQI
jgi:uncharacterized LabA/DUF88 family protein